MAGHLHVVARVPKGDRPRPIDAGVLAQAVERRALVDPARGDLDLHDTHVRELVAVELGKASMRLVTAGGVGKAHLDLVDILAGPLRKLTRGVDVYRIGKELFERSVCCLLSHALRS